MVDAEVLASRIAVLRVNITRLQRIVAGGRARFIADEDVHLKAERCLESQ